MPVLRVRRPRPSLRLVALLSAAVLAFGISLGGVAYAQDYRDPDGDGGSSGSSDRSNPYRDQDLIDPADSTDFDPDHNDTLDGGGTGSAAGRGPAATRPGGATGHRPGGAAGTPVEDTGVPLDQSKVRFAPPDPPSRLVPGTPCTKKAVACVSLGQKKSWLFKKDPETGKTVIDHGPVPVATGGPGKETPLGDFTVEWKNKNHKSGEYFVPHGCVRGTPGCEGAPMNFAVFFAEGGIAFHEGALAIRSSGCVRLSPREAEFYYTFLQLGDRVEIRN